MLRTARRVLLALCAVALILSCDGTTPTGPGESPSYLIDAEYRQNDSSNEAVVAVFDGSALYTGTVAATANGGELPQYAPGILYGTLASNLAPGTSIAFVVSVNGTELLDGSAVVPGPVEITAWDTDATLPIDIAWTGPSDVDEYDIYITDGGAFEYFDYLAGTATSYELPANTLSTSSSYLLEVSASNVTDITGDQLSFGSGVAASAYDSVTLDTQ